MPCLVQALAVLARADFWECWAKDLLCLHNPAYSKLRGSQLLFLVPRAIAWLKALMEQCQIGTALQPGLTQQLLVQTLAERPRKLAPMWLSSSQREANCRGILKHMSRHPPAQQAAASFAEAIIRSLLWG